MSDTVLSDVPRVKVSTASAATVPDRRGSAAIGLYPPLGERVQAQSARHKTSAR